MPKVKNPEKYCEVCRSYSENIFIEPYKPLSFFCSRKEEVPTKDAEKTSKRLFKECLADVKSDIKEYVEAHLPEDQKVITEENAYNPKPVVRLGIKSQNQNTQNPSNPDWIQSDMDKEPFEERVEPTK